MDAENRLRQQQCSTGGNKFRKDCFFLDILLLEACGRNVQLSSCGAVLFLKTMPTSWSTQCDCSLPCLGAVKASLIQETYAQENNIICDLSTYG